MKGVRIQSFSGPYFPAFGLNLSVLSIRMGEVRARKTRIRTLFTYCVVVIIIILLLLIYLLLVKHSIYNNI